MIEINKKLVFSYKKPPLIIAEISGNHNQNKKKFLQLIDSAFKNGADLVKIQSYEPEDITLNIKNKNFKIKNGIWKNSYLWDLYKKAHTPFKWHLEAFKLAKKHNGVLFSSPFSIRSVDLLEKFNIPLYKVASFEITDLKLINYIASKKKPIILSTGMAKISEIKSAIKEINKFHKKIIILHCVSNYPTELKDTNLKRINKLKKIFKNYFIGLSDHTGGIYSSIASLPLGIVAIEKHFKLTDNDISPDAKFSITPEKLRLLKKVNLEIFKSLKNDNMSKINKESLMFRRSIFTVKKIYKNEKINKNNIDTFRPNIGIPASEYFKILGKKAKFDLPAKTALKKKHLK